MTSREAQSLQGSLTGREKEIFMSMVVGSHSLKRKHDEPPPGKKKGGKGKKKVKKSMDPAFQERRRHQAREELKAALRMSCREADIPMTSVGYRAVVDVSDDEEDAYLDMVVDQLEEEVEAECCTPSDESPLP